MSERALVNEARRRTANCAAPSRYTTGWSIAGLPPEQRIAFASACDVVEESDAYVMGGGVNIAAHLEGICAPNGFCFSVDAYGKVKTRLHIAVTDLGLEINSPLLPYPRVGPKQG
jgi:class 3 adenylate cyclase